MAINQPSATGSIAGWVCEVQYGDNGQEKALPGKTRIPSIDPLLRARRGCRIMTAGKQGEFMRVMFVVLAAATLAACATRPPPAFVRTDGRPMAGDAVLTQQFQVDKTVCLGNREKADLSGVTVTNGGLAGVAASVQRSNAADAVFTGCMAEKGYMLTTADKADEVAAQNAAIAAQAQRQAVAEAPRR